MLQHGYRAGPCARASSHLSALGDAGPYITNRHRHRWRTGDQKGPRRRLSAQQYPSQTISESDSDIVDGSRHNNIRVRLYPSQTRTSSTALGDAGASPPRLVPTCRGPRRASGTQPTGAGRRDGSAAPPPCGDASGAERMAMRVLTRLIAACCGL